LGGWHRLDALTLAQALNKFLVLESFHTFKKGINSDSIFTMHLKIQLKYRKKFVNDSDNFVLGYDLPFSFYDHFLWFYDWARNQFVHWLIVYLQFRKFVIDSDNFSLR
jgi:hypothetical protein